MLLSKETIKIKNYVFKKFLQAYEVYIDYFFKKQFFNKPITV